MVLKKHLVMGRAYGEPVSGLTLLSDAITTTQQSL